MYKRIERARAAERRQRTGLRDANGNLLPHNIALGQHAPSPIASTTSNDDIRLLSPFDRYLSDRGSRIRRQSVCVTIDFNGGMFETTNSSEATMNHPSNDLQFQDSLLPILIGLAQHTSLHIICVEANKERQSSIESALSRCGLFTLGLKPHRLLFCTTVKGKQAIIRHIEPNLVLDDDKSMLQLLKPFIDQVVHIDMKLKEIDTKSEIRSYQSWTQFFHTTPTPVTA